MIETFVGYPKLKNFPDGFDKKEKFEWFVIEM